MNVKKILIPGASHGIGLEAARYFIANKWEVYGCGANRQDDRGMRMSEQNPNFHFMYADISKEEDVEQLMVWCGDLDAAFNNAGVGCEPKPLHEMDSSEAIRVLKVNLFGTAVCMKHEIRSMQKKGGVIINNSSVSAYKAATGADAMYSASKAGILRLTAEAAVDPAYIDRIKFYSLVPGWIETRMTSQDDKTLWAEKLPSGRAGNTREVAKLVYTVIENSGSFESGQVFYCSGGGVFV